MFLRIVLALRPGVWGDEIFSLAMATGHSLEHPAAEARPALGDFVEPPAATASSSFRRYAEHEDPAVGPGRVIRAVRLSDTNPPLYYLLLSAWTRVTGTGDQALRFFSLFWAALTLPFLWRLGRDLGDQVVGWTAVVLYAWSPVSVFYSIEGRMYSHGMVPRDRAGLADAPARERRLDHARGSGLDRRRSCRTVQPLLLRLRCTGLRPVAAPMARPPLTTRGDRSRSDHGDRRGALVRASARLARPLADHRRMAQRASPLARARHPALRAGVEPARGRQLLGRLLGGGRDTRRALCPAGPLAAPWGEADKPLLDRPPADLAVGSARGARALRARHRPPHRRFPRSALRPRRAARRDAPRRLRGSAAVRSGSCRVHGPGSGGLDRWASRRSFGSRAPALSTLRSLRSWSAAWGPMA